MPITKQIKAKSRIPTHTQTQHQCNAKSDAYVNANINLNRITKSYTNVDADAKRKPYSNSDGKATFMRFNTPAHYGPEQPSTKYWATRSSVCLLARTPNSIACSALLDSLACSAAPVGLVAPALTHS